MTWKPIEQAPTTILRKSTVMTYATRKPIVRSKAELKFVVKKLEEENQKLRKALIDISIDYQSLVESGVITLISDEEKQLYGSARAGGQTEKVRRSLLP